MDNIVKRQVGDDFGLLQEQRQRLTDAASGTTNDNYCGKRQEALFASQAAMRLERVNISGYGICECEAYL